MTQGSDQSAPATPPAAPPPATPAAAPRRHRPWLPVLIACVVAALALAAVLIPGVLLYPQAAALVPDDAALAEIQRESNDAIEERVGRLRQLLEQDVCIADGELTVPGPEGERVPVEPDDQAALPPEAPERTPVPPESLPEDTSFQGSLVDLLDRATALVIAGQSTGTAFFIGDGLAVTNRHVIGDPPLAKVQLAGLGLSGLVVARVVAHTGTHDPFTPDFALLEVPNATGALPLTLATTSQKLQDVVASGYPGMLLETDEAVQQVVEGNGGASLDPGLTQGTITTYQHPAGSEVIVHTAMISGGNSGGPLVDRCGRVLGINTFTYTSEYDAGRMNYSLASDVLIDFLRQQPGMMERVTVTEGACSPGADRPVAAEEGPSIDPGAPAPDADAPIPAPAPAPAPEGNEGG